jgi:hypothetical protein
VKRNNAKKVFFEAKPNIFEAKVTIFVSFEAIKKVLCSFCFELKITLLKRSEKVEEKEAKK